jgi:hypothetical protein
MRGKLRDMYGSKEDMSSIEVSFIEIIDIHIAIIIDRCFFVKGSKRTVPLLPLLHSLTNNE